MHCKAELSATKSSTFREPLKYATSRLLSPIQKSLSTYQNLSIPINLVWKQWSRLRCYPTPTSGRTRTIYSSFQNGQVNGILMWVSVLRTLVLMLTRSAATRSSTGLCNLTTHGIRRRPFPCILFAERRRSSGEFQIEKTGRRAGRRRTLLVRTRL